MSDTCGLGALLRLEDPAVMEDLNSLMENASPREKPYYSMAMAQFRLMNWEESSRYLRLHLENARTKIREHEQYLKKMLDFYAVEIQTKCSGGKERQLCASYRKAKETLNSVFEDYAKLPDIEELEAETGDISESAI